MFGFRFGACAVRQGDVFGVSQVDQLVEDGFECVAGGAGVAVGVGEDPHQGVRLVLVKMGEFLVKRFNFCAARKLTGKRIVYIVYLVIPGVWKMAD